MARLTARALLVVVTAAVVLYGVVLQPFRTPAPGPAPAGTATVAQTTAAAGDNYPRIANYNGGRFPSSRTPISSWRGAARRRAGSRRPTPAP